MGDPDTSGPETDQEEWSEDTLPSSPQHAGYQPLDHYQALEDDEQQEEQQEQEQEQQPEDDSTDEPLAGGDGNSRQQPDVRVDDIRRRGEITCGVTSAWTRSIPHSIEYLYFEVPVSE